MNDSIQWLNKEQVIAATTLRDPKQPESNNMALHTKGSKEAVIQNRKRLAKEAGIPLSSFVFSCQTHSCHIQKICAEDKGRGTLAYEDGIPDCDALYTREKGIALGVFHADCVPILLYDPITSVIAAVHSGWQGTVKEITAKTIQRLLTQEQVSAADLYAYIGPAIARQSFEVGEDVLEGVRSMSFDIAPFITYKDNGKAWLDNKGLNMQMLLRAGVLPEHITMDKNDTFIENEAFFSYRRDHDCGRHMSFIMMK